MKNYFDFILTGKKLFPYWLAFLVAVVVPYAILLLNLSNIQQGKGTLVTFLTVFLVVILLYSITFFILKLSIENVSFKGNSFSFTGTFFKFFGKLVLGMFLTIITLGIYGAWFVKDIYNFFVNNTFYNSN
ncbi:MAG: hypothetical protein K0B09_06825, partial [Bacteroidales bacterium]|nr:hypothetical protein [Bacteroidales bacterium]